jgi:WhiB family redox-sensing transcriptional regulator
MLSSDACTGSSGWMSWGACQGQDPEFFFPIAADGPAVQQISAAKAVCGRCAVRVMCLSYALCSAQDGIWGGTTGEERRAVRERHSWSMREQPDGMADLTCGCRAARQPERATAAASGGERGARAASPSGSTRGRTERRA